MSSHPYGETAIFGHKVDTIWPKSQKIKITPVDQRCSSMPLMDKNHTAPSSSLIAKLKGLSATPLWAGKFKLLSITAHNRWPQVLAQAPQCYGPMFAVPQCPKGLARVGVWGAWAPPPWHWPLVEIYQAFLPNFT